MSEELQKEIDRLKSENAKLMKDLAGAQDDLKEVRHEARDRRHEAKTLTEQLAALSKERDDFRTKAEADPEGLRKSLQDAQGVIRGLKHDGAFAKVAKGLRVNDPTKLTDLVKLANYAPEGDEPDEVKISAAFQEALKGRPWLVDAETTAATATTTKSAAGAATTASGGATGATTTQTGGKPGPGAERGQSLSSEGKSQPEGRIPGRL
jgi:FtsZ-binding cell division protein ZapB